MAAAAEREPLLHALHSDTLSLMGAAAVSSPAGGAVDTDGDVYESFDDRLRAMHAR